MTVKAQSVQIDSTFTTDGEIFPFEPGDTIYGLSISGTVQLFSDTSLVRVILSDIYGNEWMVYEAYPMIVEDTVFEIEEECDETCYLGLFIPSSLKIDLINSNFDLDRCIIANTMLQSCDSLNRISKLNKEVEKTEYINRYINHYDWQWIADISYEDMAQLNYASKIKQYGLKYNMLGLDYYHSGIYKNIQSNEITIDNTSLTKSFDWRSKHDANIPGSMYYDNDPDDPQVGNGWMTKVKNQTPCGACTAFGSIAALEAVTNLYYNYHVDYEEDLLLSERDAFTCSRYDNSGSNVGCICSRTWGKPLTLVIDYIVSTGVVNDECFPWINNSTCCSGEIPNCSPVYSGKCDEEDIRVIVKPDNCFHENKYPLETLIERLKTHLINDGPIICTFNYNENTQHVMALVGFSTDPVSGDLFWILKDSQGTLNPLTGYHYWAHSYFEDVLYGAFYFYSNSLITDPINYLSRRWFDKDQDGYYNWGIGERPQNFLCSNEEDWNDNDNRTGPCDDNFIGQPVKPEMEVKIGTSNPHTITNHGFYFYPDLNTTILSFRIINPGNANLNLAEINPVTKSGPDYEKFLVSQPYSDICMGGGESSFTIELLEPNPNNIYQCLIHIALQNIDKDVLEDFEFALIYNGCEMEGEDQYIDEYTVVSDYEIVPNDIYIERNGILEVTGSLAMYPGSDIYVEPGGLLKINGGLVTGSCGQFWNGIDILGDPDLPQVATYQGKVEMINGGCIEYAETAIETAYHPEPRRWYPSGGIVYCNSGQFKDNMTDVRFYPFTNRHPISGQVMPNFSSFNLTTFETTNDYYLLCNDDAGSHLFFDDVEGISIRGCVFGNYSNEDQLNRGKGIESYTAGFEIKRACQHFQYPCTVPCRFENLDYGIRAFNSNGFFNIIVDSALFNYNKRGIHFRLVSNPTVIRSEFNISDPKEYWTGDTLAGLYLDAYTKGFVVEENTFSGSSRFELAAGIQTLNTGVEQNEIYNNAFNDLKIGISCAGENRDGNNGPGLCLKCNDFEDCSVDIYVTYTVDENEIPIITGNTGIAQKQGESNLEEPYYNDLAAGNTFSDVTSYNYINSQGCGYIHYIYHGNNQTNEILDPNYLGSDFISEPDPYATYTKDGACLSHLGGSITLSMEKNLLTTETALISDYNDTLLLTIDGGNTEGLNYEVITSFPEEALVIRQNLINESPYLSDTVMVSAIEKEEVLPGAMIRDILVQNPQAPKSKKILEALENRQDTIPGYMMEEIMQGLNTYGAMEILEQKLGEHIAKRDMAWKNINLYFKNDTVNFGSSIDSLISIYLNENRLSTRYELAFMYLDQDDSANVNDILNSIPAEFDLSAQELSFHNQYRDIFDILMNVKNDTTGLDSLQIQALNEIFQEDKDIPGCYASNLLIKERSIFYHEPVYIYNELKSDPPWRVNLRTNLRKNS